MHKKICFVLFYEINHKNIYHCLCKNHTIKSLQMFFDPISTTEDPSVGTEETVI